MRTTEAAVKAAAAKKTREGTAEIVCPGCGKKVRKQKNYLKVVKRPTCSRPCRSKMMKGENHWRWKGGTWLNPDGYVVVNVDEGGPRRRQRLEHHLVMEKIIGRKLRPGELVHHRDGDKANNRPSNLALMTEEGRKEHARLHAMRHARDAGGRFSGRGR